MTFPNHIMKTYFYKIKVWIEKLRRESLEMTTFFRSTLQEMELVSTLYLKKTDY